MAEKPYSLLFQGSAYDWPQLGLGLNAETPVSSDKLNAIAVQNESDPNNIYILLLKNPSLIIGYAFATRISDDSAKAEMIAVSPAYRGKGCMGILMDGLEAALSQRRFSFVEMDATKRLNVNKSINNHYKNRVVSSKEG